VKKIIFVLAALIATKCTFAQQKVGHVNSTEIIESMPEYKTMSNALDKKKEEYSKLIQTMYADYEKKTKELQSATNMSQVMQDMKVQELKDLEKRINDFQQKAQKELAAYAQDYSKPLQSKFQNAVKEVAKEQGFSYIFDLASNAVPYYPENTGDASAAVRAKLGITGAPAATKATMPVGTPKR
jgi:outer membrane protein